MVEVTVTRSLLPWGDGSPLPRAHPGSPPGHRPSGHSLHLSVLLLPGRDAGLEWRGPECNLGRQMTSRDVQCLIVNAVVKGP